MRILHIALGGCLKAPPVDYGLTEDTGGHIAYVLGAAMAQAERPDVTQVDIVTRAFSDPGLGPEYAADEEYVGPKVRILRLRTRRDCYLAKEDLNAELPAITAAFCALLDRLEHRPDVIHAHFSDAATVARAAFERFAIPWIYTPHSLAREKVDCDLASQRVSDELAAIRTAHAIIVSSRDEAERQIMAYDPDAAGRVHRISPGVTFGASQGTDHGRRLIAPFLRQPEKPIVFAVARPVRKKNLAALVRAFGMNARLREAANLVILAGLRTSVGEGPEEQVAVHQDLIRLIDRHDLWGRVALPRRHTATEVRSLYDLAAVDGVFANPALHEPFGLTVVEAAQAGVPVVATRSGGPSSIIGDIGYGALVDPEDAGELADRLLDMLGDPERERRCREARDRACRLYQWHGWARESLAVCRGITERRAKAPRRASRILACDVDGTLTGDRKAAAAFAKWSARRDDTCILVATGRSISEARRVIAAWSLPCPDILVTSVGSEIWRCDGWGDYRLCRGYAATISDGWQREEVVHLMAGLGITAQPLHDQRRWKVSYYGSPADAARATQVLADNGVPARVVHSHGSLIDVLPVNAGKAAAIGYEAHRLDLTLADCIAAGDSGNDLDMLSACGAAILPANARDGIAELLRGKAFQSRHSYAAGVLDGLAAIYGPADRLALRHA
ncbi:sucrose-phosphate synthase [Primorskyibacter flagellatus]|uniref:sucrose-phosphate synthase n=1 Tax=Primorskyibacter flagellatus TaxID=1387277 RepID=A0A917AAV1_9RHOB|nr:HAD-IIB family hydrolase [Primorskyibacter flagellatus]GGE38903.1 sucrose-phosphate synthase [Primorskyibacter flagellatus]